MTSTLQDQKKTAEPLVQLESAGGAAAANVAALLEEEAEELGTASHEPTTGNPPA